MHSMPDAGPTAPGPDAASAAPTTFLDTLRGLGFTEQDPRPYAVHTTFRYDNDDRAILVYCHPDDFTEPGDDGFCDLEVVCFDQGGHRDLWQTTIRHLDALPLALTLLRAAVGNDH
jgi:hypothetical protein